jgi:peptidoglycan/xylan/chitin deacetylase (PgdA/CDA1 family)
MADPASTTDSADFRSEAKNSPSGWTLLPTGIWVWLALKTVSIACFLAHRKLLGVLFFFGPDPWLLYQILAPTSCGFGRTYSHFRTAAKEVWLTIDDGPDPITTPALLDLLNQHKARATFFVIGARVDANPELAAEIVRRGHELGNHTQNHPPHRIWRSWPRATASEIDECQRAIARASGHAPTRFRAPVGVKNVFLHSLLKRRGVDFIAWSARGFDCILKPDTAIKRILKSIRPGAVVLVHEGKGDLARVALIDRVLTELTAQGYRAIIPDAAALRSES